MFLSILPSEYCKGETLQSLKYHYTLPDFLALKEYVEIMHSMDKARELDEKNKPKSR